MTSHDVDALTSHDVDALNGFVAATAAEFGIPGLAVGVWADGREIYACHGVTSIENPLPVDRDTVFLVGSVSKTLTATALMCLVEQGRVDLGAPVRRYVPELKLADERAAAEITVLQLLNHTSGLDWALLANTGEGDDALAAHVAGLAGLNLIAPPGTRTSYSQAGYNLAGRIIENVTGMTYERAVASLVCEPVGLSHTFFAHDDVMTRRFALGHNAGPDGALSIARPWRPGGRGNNPGGGIASTVADQLRWARFHLGDGRAQSGERLLPFEILQKMKEPTATLRGSNLGDSIGICWFLRDAGGVRTAEHLGSSDGQFAALVTVPERGFAVVSVSNAAPNGIPANQAIVRWALHHYLGVTDRDPEPLSYDDARARQVAGAYENDAMTLTIDADGMRMRIAAQIRPEIRAAADTELPPDHEPADMGLLPGDEYVVTSGGLKGLRGFFSRDHHGAVVGVDVAGRLFTRR